MRASSVVGWVAGAVALASFASPASAGIVDDGSVSNGGPDSTAIESSLLFGNSAVHSALFSLPLTAADLTNDGRDPQDPQAAAHAAVFQVWSDPSSVVLLSYLWADAHAPGDDLTFDNPFTQAPVHFAGSLGLCDRGSGATPRGAAVDEPLSADLACQHYVSAVLLAQSNASPVHNPLSVRGPTSDAGPGYVGDQLTSLAPRVLVSSEPMGPSSTSPLVTAPCAPGALGGANCGWTPAYVGTCPPGASFALGLAPGSNAEGIPLVLLVAQGVHAHDYPYAEGGMCAGNANQSCTDPEVLGWSVSDQTPAPRVSFTCPASGTFGVQWATFDRGAQLQPVDVTFTVVPADPRHPASYPADEVDIFSDREGYWEGNVFGPGDVNPGPFGCEPHCTVRSVLFPNMHVWLSSSWAHPEAYYRARLCAPDGRVCLAQLEGTIEGGRAPCAESSLDVDTNPQPSYPGRPRPIGDVGGCFLDDGGRGQSQPATFQDDGVTVPAYGVTSFFARDSAGRHEIGSCFAVPAAVIDDGGSFVENPACQYLRQGPDGNDRDRE